MEHARQCGASERHACHLVHQPRGTQRYQPTQRNDEDALTRAIITLADRYGRGVEGELGWFRRNWLVPVPEASALDTLNEHILDACLESQSRTIIGRGMTVGQASEREREHLSPLAEEGFPIHESLYPLLVDGKGRVKVKTNWYSTPLRLWFGAETGAESKNFQAHQARLQHHSGRARPVGLRRHLGRMEAAGWNIP